MSKTNALVQTFHKVGFTLKKHSPEILVVAGVVGTVASTVMACRATTKAAAITEKMKKDLEDIHTVAETTDEETYSENDLKKDTAIVYAKTGLEFVKLYAPSVILGGLSIAGILTSHKILRERSIATAAAYTAVAKGFKEYRGRVVDRFGKEMDRDLRYNIKAKEIETTVVDEKTGKEKKVKQVVEVCERNEKDAYGDFTRCYDDGCVGWTKNPELNMMFLKQQERYANELLDTRGHVFLNEVFDMLGFPRTKAGNSVGWLKDSPIKDADGYISFGIYDMNKPANLDFINGYERSIWLDFNVDGPILDYI